MSAGSRTARSLVVALLCLLSRHASSAAISTAGQALEERGEALSLGAVAWNYTLPLHLRRRGLVFQGSGLRMRRVVHKLLTGQTVRVAAIGGSISLGQGASSLENGWVALLTTWLSAAFPKASLYNGALGGTPSGFFTLCLESCLGEGPVDLVLAEFALNDGYLSAAATVTPPHCSPLVREYEHLVRRVLGLPSQPALAMVQVLVQHQVPDATGPQPHPAAREFHETSEDARGALAQYYDVPWLSLRSATWWHAKVVHDPDLSYGKIMSVDRSHPADLGHKVMADLVVHMIEQAADDLKEEPYREEETKLAAVPPGSRTMCRDNQMGEASRLCMVGMSLPGIAVSNSGFTYTDEGRGKPGLVASAIGNQVVLEFSTQRTGADNVSVVLAHLASYKHMGVVSVKCVAGCACVDSTLDSHITERHSQTYLFNVDVTQHPNCRVSVTVLPQTSSGEHKFKLVGVLVAAVAGQQPQISNQWFMRRDP